MSNSPQVAFVLSTPAVSDVTGWPIGFWLAEPRLAIELLGVSS